MFCSELSEPTSSLLLLRSLLSAEWDKARTLLSLLPNARSFSTDWSGTGRRTNFRFSCRIHEDVLDIHQVCIFLLWLIGLIAFLETDINMYSDFDNSVQRIKNWVSGRPATAAQSLPPSSLWRCQKNCVSKRAAISKPSSSKQNTQKIYEPWNSF